MLLPLAAAAQQFVTTQPDCIINFTFTATGQTSPTAPNNGLDNRNLACDTWNVTYASSGFSGVSVILQGAANNAGVPGSYGTGFSVQQSIVTGSNPMTNTTGGFLWVVGYSPWVRIAAGTLTGSGVINGAAYGWRIPSSGNSGGGSGGCVGTASTPCIVAGPDAAGAAPTKNPVQIAGSDGTDLRLPFYDAQGIARQFLGCPNSAEVALSGTGYTQIIAASGSTVIYVCKVFVTGSSAGSPVVTTFTLAQGACGGAPTELENAAGVTGLDQDFGGALRSAAGAAFCVKESVANSDKVTVTYAQF